MVKTKTKSKKAQKHGVDFKKIQRKIGRKLPPPKNATNTEIKSRAIVLPEQSVASEKAGLAVNKKGLTLKELLQQTSHHNAKVRKDALVGVKDILIKHPDELMLHKHFVIEKLRGRISDDDKSVRETLYQLFKSVIFPGCAKDNQGQSVSLMMTYIFIAMDSTIIDVRLVGFKFFDLIIQYYPSSLSSYAEKILHNYEDILQKNQFLEDKSKLKSILDGLVHCLSLLPFNESQDYTATEKETPAHGILHAFEPEVATKPIGLTDIAKKSKDLLPILVGLFLDIMPVVHTSQLDAQSCSCMQFILQSIDLIVKFSLCWISESEQDPQVLSPFPKPDVTTYPSLSLVILKKLWDIFPLNIGHQFGGKVDDRIFMLNTVITKIFFQLSNWNYSSSALLERFLEFIESSLYIEIQSGKMSLGKHLLPLVPFIPKLAMGIAGNWRFRLLQVFTEAFKNCNPESSMKLACLAAIEEMLAPEKSWIDLDADDPALLDYQIKWMKELPSLLVSLDHKNPLCSKAVLRLQLRMGKAASMNSQFSREFDNKLYDFSMFFSNQNDQDICNGPFIKLPPDVQELAICCLYYFSFVDSKILQSLISCCLCDDLEPYMVFRILEVMQSAFRAGHIKVEDYTSFHVTLLSRFRVYPGKSWLNMEKNGKSNRKTFKLVTCIVCTCLSEIGEDYLVLKMLEKIIVDQICSEIPVDNKCAFLRLLVTLDSKPTQLSDESIVNMSHFLPQYLIDIVPYGQEFDDRNSDSAKRSAKRSQYYLIPSFYLFHRCKRLLKLVLNEMGTLVSDVSSAIGSHHPSPALDRLTSLRAISYVLRLIYEDVRIQQTLLSCNCEIETLLHKLLNILSAEGKNLSLDERHEIRSAYDQLRTIAYIEVARHP